MKRESASRSAPARLPAREYFRSSLGESEFFNLRALIALLLCASACFIAVGVAPAFLRPEAHAKVSHPAVARLTFADRVAYQKAIEEVYWRHRIWPKENARPKPPLDAVMSQAQLEKKVEDYLRDSQALEDYWRRAITGEQLQAEMDRMAQHTKQPGVLREIFAALGNDPFIIAECLARQVLTQRLITELNNKDRGNTTTVAFLKEPLRLWATRAEAQMPMTMAAASANYTLPVIAGPSGTCADDTWTPTSFTNAAAARSGHTAIWTGSEMIVWGGGNASSPLNTGGRYNPSTDSWTVTNTTNAPSGRSLHTAVWTGSEMIVWGGVDNISFFLNTGGRYNPSTDSWTATSTTGAPDGRFTHTAVWSGNEMIIWGGVNNDGDLNTGGRYNPGTDNWAATSASNAPDARENHTAVWTGREMIVWGGSNPFGILNTGGRYNPGLDIWTATSTTDAPSPRDFHTAVWTGSEMVVWGGGFSGYLNTGGRYNPSTNSWVVISTTNAPAGRRSHTAVWTGNEMIVWGGGQDFPFPTFFNTGGRYNPSTDSWMVTSTTNAPEDRGFHTGVWSGSQMIVWGGYDGTSVFNSGGRYCAQCTGRCAPTPRPRPTPPPRP